MLVGHVFTARLLTASINQKSEIRNPKSEIRATNVHTHLGERARSQEIGFRISDFGFYTLCEQMYSEEHRKDCSQYKIRNPKSDFFPGTPLVQVRSRT